jgi:hypothetical protein
LKRHSVWQCTGKVCKIPPRNMTKTVIKAQVNNSTNTSMVKYPQNLWYKTLGRHICRPHRAIHSQSTRGNRNWRYVSDYDQPINKLAWNCRIAGGRRKYHSLIGARGCKGISTQISPRVH